MDRSEQLKQPYPGAILECIVGSTLHGTSVDDGLEDLDLMSIVVETPKQFIGFGPVDTWVERTKPDGVRSEAGDVDRSVYGLRKYLHLALKGNPTMLLALFVPAPFRRGNVDPRGMELQGMAPHIVSKQVYQPWRGYMKQQHERLLGLRGQRNVTRPELVDKYGYDTKYAGHIVRLGVQGIEILTTGRMTLPMPEQDRELVLAVRTGKYTLAEVSKLIIAAEEGIEKAYVDSPLPLWPNRKLVEDWMINTYIESWSKA
jgi:hypothetical protein